MTSPEAPDAESEDLEPVEPFLETLLPWMERFASYFDSEVRGWENVPRVGSMLLVGNHSGGALVPDTSAFISGWYREFGIDRSLTGLAHDAMFKIPRLAEFMRNLGQTPANHENAGQALDEGAAVLVYPGGAYDNFRPWTDRDKIELNGHKGFIRLALRKQVPVIPVVGHGGHSSTIVLSRGDELMKLLGVEDHGMPVAPLLWQVPWGVSIPFLPGIPLPAKITMQVLPPMSWASLPPEAAEDAEIVDRCYDEIVVAMQGTLDGLAKENPYPVLRRMRSWVSGFF
jgi:1-acyl-sn-glycerol-3-phosphate acyltransferase